jgi:hypothetical protein
MELRSAAKDSPRFLFILHFFVSFLLLTPANVNVKAQYAILVPYGDD